MTGETVYRPLQVVGDQTEDQIDSMSHDEKQVFGPRPFCKWWCQEGPVDNCCCCFPLRTEEDVSERCKELSQSIKEKEDEAGFISSFLPVFYVVGFVLVIFSFVGIGSAVTGKSKLAKIYMVAYPFIFVFNIAMLLLRLAVAPSTITGEFQAIYAVSIFFTAYYTKVSWSFFKRRKVLEDRQQAIDASSQGHTADMSMI